MLLWTVDSCPSVGGSAGVFCNRKKWSRKGGDREMRALRVVLVLTALIARLQQGCCSGGGAEETASGESSSSDFGRCLKNPVVAGEGAVVLYDIVVNLQSMRVFFLGPHKVLWIVPVTPPLQEHTVPFIEHFGEGRDLHWLPRLHDAASLCHFARQEGETTDASTRADEELTTYVTLHGDPYAHVNLASCPLPVWALQDLLSGRGVTVELGLSPRPLFQAIPCTESNGTSVGACEACRELVQRQAGTRTQPDLAECHNSTQMALRFVRLPPLRMCLPSPQQHVELSLCF